jgi:hypothetical protein
LQEARRSRSMHAAVLGPFEDVNQPSVSLSYQLAVATTPSPSHLRAGEEEV